MNKLAFALASLGLLTCVPSFAQTRAAAAPVAKLPSVTVTGNPLGSSDLIVPSTQYSGTELLLRSKTTLGETLDGTPGISSTYFGPNASRPVIRGLDGDRIRILNNGGSIVDASGLSFDHAVTVEPLSIDRIEVLRGPGALQYGGSAVGGVVNVIDNRIPREALFDASGGFSGKVDLGLGSGKGDGKGERSAGAALEAGTAQFGLHLDVTQRTTDDVAVPITLACSKTGSPALANRICNSASDTQGAALGGSLLFKQGYLGASFSSLSNNYGTVAEDKVTIRMKSDRSVVAGEWRGLGQTGGLGSLFQSVKGHWGRSVYEHTEFEGADAGTVFAGTVFKSSGNDLRLEARQKALATGAGALDGVIGLQVESTDFSAQGAEAFAPYSTTQQTAAFVYEELTTSWGKLSVGARVERVDVQSFGNPDVARFEPATRSFSPTSFALGGLYKLAPGWQLSSNLAYTERAPKDYELFADGPHLATNAYEVGNSQAGVEKSTNLDIGLNWKSGHHRFGVSAFVNRFSNYLSLEASGRLRDTQGNGAAGAGSGGGAGPGATDCGDGTSNESACTARLLPEYVYRQVGAQLHGVEISGSYRLLDAPANTLDLELHGDVLRATNTTTGEGLPRIAPSRLGASLQWGAGPWGARIGFTHASAQDNLPAGQLKTEAYTLWNAAATYRQTLGKSTLQWYARLDNITDTLAYSASSILTQTAPGKAPLPGRNLKVGLQVAF